MNRFGLPFAVALSVFTLFLTSACEQTPAVEEKEAELPYSLVVAPGRNPTVGTYFVVQGIQPEDQTVPEASRLPAQPFAAALYCGSTWAHPSAAQMREYSRFTNWLRTSGAEQSNTHLAIEDVRVSCEADSTLQIKTNDFQRSLALLASGFEGERTLTRGKGDAADQIQFFADGQPLNIQVTPQEIRAVEGEGGALPGTAVARQGGKLDTLTAGGEAGGFAYDPAQPAEVIVRREGQPFWDVLTVDYNNGRLAWRQTASDPLRYSR